MRIQGWPVGGPGTCPSCVPRLPPETFSARKKCFAKSMLWKIMFTTRKRERRPPGAEIQWHPCGRWVSLHTIMWTHFWPGSANLVNSLKYSKFAINKFFHRVKQPGSSECFWGRGIFQPLLHLPNIKMDCWYNGFLPDPAVLGRRRRHDTQERQRQHQEEESQVVLADQMCPPPTHQPPLVSPLWG